MDGITNPAQDKTEIAPISKEKVKETSSPKKWAIGRKQRSKWNNVIKSFRVSSLNRYGSNPHGDKKLVFKGYFSLYRYARILDRVMQGISLVAAVLAGSCIPLMAHKVGQFLNTLIMLQVVKYNPTLSLNSTSCNRVTPLGNFSWKTSSEVTKSTMNTFFESQLTVAVIYFLLNTTLFVFWYIPAEKQVTCWAKEYFKGLLKKDLRWFDYHGVHDYPTETIKNIDRIRNGIGVQIPLAVTLLSTFVQCTICIIWKCYSSWIFILSAVVIIPVLALFPNLIATFAAKEIVTGVRAVVPLVTFAEEVFRVIQNVIIFNGQHREIQRFKKEQKFSLQSHFSETLAISSLTGLLYLLLNIYLAMIFWHGIKLVWEYRTCDLIQGFQIFDAEVFFTIFLCVTFGMLNFSFVLTVRESCAIAETTGAAVAYIIDGNSSAYQFNNQGLSPSRVSGKVEFQDVRFTYPTRNNVLVLSNLSLIVEPGWKAGFVGPPGSGLSTIFKLVLKNYLPDSGFIKLDDTDIRTMNYSWYLGQIGYITHDPMLFNESIEENVRKGNPEATQTEIEQACELAEAHDAILELTDGYGTCVGNGGEVISGKLRLQIALARALIRNPTILLLDEPTANLDLQSALSLQLILDKVSANRTTLVIPNRLTTLVNANIIFVLTKGSIMEQGTYAELLRKKGIFQQMVSKMEMTGRRSRKWELRKKFNSLEYTDTDREKYPSIISIGHSLGNIGFGAYPDIVSVKTIQAWMKQKYVTVSARQISQEISPGYYETLYEKKYCDPDQAGPFATASESKDSVLSTWETCAERDKKYLGNRSSPRYDLVNPITLLLPSCSYLYIFDFSQEEKTTFACYSILRLTLSSPCCIALGTMTGLALALCVPVYSYLYGLSIKSLMEPDKNKALTEGKQLASYFLLLGVVMFFLHFLHRLSLGVAANKCYLKAQRRLFTSILRQERSWFDNPENKPSKLKLRISRDVESIKYIVGNFYGTMIRILGSSLSCIALALYLSPTLTAYTICMAPLSAASTLIDGYLIQFYGQKRTNKMKGIQAVTAELFDNRQAASALQLEHYFLNRLEFIIDLLNKSRTMRTAPYVRALSYGIAQGGGFILFAFFILVSRNTMLSHDIPLSAVLTISNLLIFEMMKFGVEFAIIPYLQNGFRTAAKVLRIIKRHPEINLESGATAEDFKGDVVFRNVSFWFSAHPEVQILKGVSFKAEAGKTVAIVGSAGCGKSVCLQLILRLVEPKLGKVQIDGTDISKVNCFQLRQQVALFEPEPTIFDRTVRENIAYGNNSEDANINEIMDAAKQANIHNFISSLPLGYETSLGSSNTLLNQGQRQRIALARIFLKDPRILLIEESTICLDQESDRKLQLSLSKARIGRTCLITAHRLKTVEMADLIVVLHQGAVQEHGSHQELMSRNQGMYKQMYEMAVENKKDFFDVAFIEKSRDRIIISSRFPAEPKPSEESNLLPMAQVSQSEPNLSKSLENDEPSTSTLDSETTFNYHDLADRIIERWGHCFGIK